MMDHLRARETDSSPPLMRIYTFGGITIEQLVPDPSDPIPRYQRIPHEVWQSRGPALSMLKILISRPALAARQATQEELIDAIWTEDEQGKMGDVEKALRAAASVLRKVLTPEGSSESLLLVIPGTGGESTIYKLARQDRLWLDADYIESLVARAIRTPDIQAVLPLWQEASSLYRGGFLENNRYQDWSHARRESLHADYRRLVLYVADVYLRSGDVRIAGELLEPFVSLHPTDEDALGLLLLVLEHQEQYHAAWRLYRRAREQEGQQDQQISPRLHAIAKRIREHLLTPAQPIHVRAHTNRISPSFSSMLPSNTSEIAPELDGTGSFDISRRQLLWQTVSLGSTSIITPPDILLHSLLAHFSQAVTKPTNIDETTLKYLEMRTQHYWQDRHSAVVASSELLSYVKEHLQKILSFLDRSLLPGERLQLCAAASNTAQLIGHLLFDLNEYSHARAFQQAAIQGAQEAGNLGLEAVAWGRMSFTWTYSGQTNKALPCIQRARFLAAEKTTTTVQAYLASVEAEIQAILGDRAACLKALDDAASIESYPQNEEENYWLRFDHSRLAGYQGICFRRLYHPEDTDTFSFLTDAQKALKSALGRLTPSMIQRRSTLLIDLAGTYTQQREYEMACELAIQAVAIIQLTKSKAAVKRLLHLRQDLGMWDNTPCVQNLDGHIELLLKQT
jgi:DNA-binding SARP family transcriptional activator